MVTARTETFLHRVFEFGIFIKAINGGIETVSGFLILFVSKTTFYNIFLLLARRELLQDPNDPLVRFLDHRLLHLSAGTKEFAALYILAHGILNIFLAIFLFRDKLWAYPAAIGFNSLIIGYQIYRVAYHHSPVLAFITAFDILFVALAWHEYHYIINQRSSSE